MAPPAPSSTLRPDLAVIAAHIGAATRVLDVGCGDGELMTALVAKGCDARGLELDATKVARAVARGLSVVQGDCNADLADFPDASFDTVVLSQTLQTTLRPDRVIDDLLRIGGQAFVSFPNFAQWRIRIALMFGGTMPVTRQLPARWYDTPNIHHVTIDDFRALLAERDVKVAGQWFLSGEKLRNPAAANLFADHAVFLLRR